MMHVDLSVSGDDSVLGRSKGWREIKRSIRARASRMALAMQHTDNSEHHSLCLFSTDWPSHINNSAADVVNLHWLQAEMMSVADIAAIRKPVVWTLHDMWPFCGAEHYSFDSRWCEGYNRNNRPATESGLDINRWLWRRKRTLWRQPRRIVAPSRWMAGCVLNSALMQKWPLTVIANALDTDIWAPLAKQTAREIWRLPQQAPLVMFGALGGDGYLKGFDLFSAAMNRLRPSFPDLEVLLFGGGRADFSVSIDAPVHCLGRLHDDLSLRLLYAAADVFVAPSRMEAFGQTASEAHACGVPVVAFDNSGLADIVEHERTGYLAKAFDAADLAHGVAWVLQDKDRSRRLGEAARQRALDCWSNKVVAQQYVTAYADAIAAARDIRG